MKVLHVPFSYYPDPVGGTEVYVSMLVQELTALGMESVVAVLDSRDETHIHHGVRVHRIRMVTGGSREVLDGRIPQNALAPFLRVVDAERPDIVHLHLSTALTTPQFVQEIHQRGIAVVFTYHLPTATCQRGTLMLWGETPCDGVMRAGRCTACSLQGLGVPRPAADLVARVPVAAGRALFASPRLGRARTVLRMRELVAARLAATRGFLAEVDRIVVLAEWSRDVLRRNGVPDERMCLSRHGLPNGTEARSVPARKPGDPLRVAFFGRLGTAKGADILVEAVRLADTPIQLDIYGIVQDSDGAGFASLRQTAGGNEQVRVLPAVPTDRVVDTLREYDVLAVPSRWLETGPLAVLDAFAAGTPVLGMRRGGIAELVRDGVDGVLVDGESPEIWRNHLVELARDSELLDRLRAGIKPPRHAARVAEDMLAVYHAARRGGFPRNSGQEEPSRARRL